MAERFFPMQGGPAIPWATAQVIYEAYAAMHGRQQTLERMAERGGFGWAEVALIFKELRRRNSALADRLLADGNRPLTELRP